MSPGFCVVCCLHFLCRLPVMCLNTWLIVCVGVLPVSNLSGQGVVVCKVELFVLF